jgi:uncharacterized membrane protein (GlpM family)
MSLSSTLVQFGWKFLLGGGIVVLATYLSEADRPALAGIAVLFPGITLASYFAIGYANGVGAIRESMLGSVFAAVGFGVLLVVMYVATFYFDVYGVVAAALLAWLVVTFSLLTLVL